jgi:ribosome recycling factor
MPQDKLVREFEDRMQKTIKVLVDEFRGMRTGRAAPALVENIKVSYYGNPTPLKQIATISAPEAALLVVRPYDISSIGEIQKAIQKSDIGINPSSDGKLVRLSLPPLSEERRKQLVHRARESAEKARVSLRSLRRDVNKEVEKFKKDGVIGEDEMFRLKDRLQDALTKHEDEIASKLDGKVNELLNE